MHSAARPVSPQPSQQSQISSRAPTLRKKIRNVRGIGAALKDSSGAFSDQLSHSWTVGRDSLPLNRKSTGTSTEARKSSSRRRKHRVQQSTATEIQFFETEPADSPSITEKSEPFVVVDNMMNWDAPYTRQSRRPPVRMDAQDGPWSVSVAETPHDPHSYSLYIKTPTHNLTLTRTAMEIIGLHHKLRETHPGMQLPTFPLDASTLPPPIKRKSTFLHTLSRLASPNSSKAYKSLPSNRAPGVNAGSPPTQPAALPAPSISPLLELGDPFLSSDIETSLDSTAIAPAPNVEAASPPATNTTITGLAAYLTTVSNNQVLRQARVWKRFVRVREDDLESVRVERAIKRVRSDLAAHVVPKTPVAADYNAIATAVNIPVDVNAVESGRTQEIAKDVPEHGADADTPIDKAQEEDAAAAGDAVPQPVDGVDLTADASTANGEVEKEEKVAEPTTPVATRTEEPTPAALDAVTPVASAAAAARIHRSQSADPDKSSRLSRAYVESTPTSVLSQVGDQTGDESSASTTGNRRVARKKRSQSIGPYKESFKKSKVSPRKVVVDDFEMMRVLGKGCAGKVLLVRHKLTSDLYALKAITKRHVLAHQELQHTLTEQAVLKRMAAEAKDPFVVKLWWSFHDKENLFLVMDFHPGGDLATQLARWGRLGRDRARFYAAEIVEGVEGLHAAGVIYRDLKPENILIGADGHIVLTDFGLSKEFPRRSNVITAPSTPHGSRTDFYSSTPGLPETSTPPWMKSENGQELATGWPGQLPGHSDSTSTFCGTAEYLAPEVIQGLNYSYEVDWWSFGTMLFEMLTGITPFWANNHSDMYVRVLQDELQFPDDRAIDQDTKSLIRGLLQRNPALRMCEPRIKRHPYFSMIDWSHVYYKRYIPPYIPPIDPSNASDTQNFDDTFLDMEPVIDDGNDNEQTDTDQERAGGDQTDTDRTDPDATTPSQSRSSSVVRPVSNDGVDVFDGYSFKGRHSVILDEDEDEEESEGSDEEEEEEEELLMDDDVDVSPGPSADVTPEQEPTSLLPTLDEDANEPKTPEARPSAPLPDVSSSSEEGGLTRPVPAEVDPSAPSKDVQEVKTKPVLATAPPQKTLAARTVVSRPRNRREKSGVPALDRYLSDTIDEDGEATEREEEDEDWDFVEAGDGEDRNGAKGTSLFARGVVDRYRLAVFRKGSTTPHRAVAQSPPGGSKEIEGAKDPVSPTPSEKQRRGRNQGLTFRSPRQFLQPKPAPSTYSGKASARIGMSSATSGTLSASTASSGGLLTPSSTLPPSLKSKGSSTSVTMSSDNLGIIDQELIGPADHNVRRSRPRGEPEPRKPRKLRKYKEGAEKVFSLFAASPRQA